MTAILSLARMRVESLRSNLLVGNGGWKGEKMAKIPVGIVTKEWVDNNGNKRQTIEWNYEMEEEVKIDGRIFNSGKTSLDGFY